jgi:phage tail-like protein
MRYLPGIYHDQRFVSRLLALCESFWGPIERQIDVLDCYFDPRYAPAALLRWLGVWVGLDLEGRWPEERQRALIGAAVGLYRKRGTRHGLVEALCLLTDIRHFEVGIVEHFASDAALGASVLGPAFALGVGNIPHTFDVTLRLPPVEGADGESRAAAAAAREREIERIIEIMKPAHTRYRLRIDTIDNHGRQVHHELPATPHQGE